MSDVIFQPLRFKNLTVKNRIFRSNIAGRFDNYDGSGTQIRLNWEVKFARGGVGAILSSFVTVRLADSAPEGDAHVRVPVTEVDPDRHRLDMWTTGFATA